MKSRYILPALLLFSATALSACATESQSGEEVSHNPGIPVQFVKDENGIVHIFGYNGDELGTVNAEKVCDTEGGLNDETNPLILKSYEYNPATGGETVHYQIDCTNRDIPASIGS